METYIKRLVARFGTATALAAKIGMTVSAFSRAVHEEGTFSLENCLRLADAFGDDPCVVLRIAGKLDQADLLQRLRREESALNPRALRHIRAWKRISPEHQDYLTEITEGLPDDPRSTKQKDASSLLTVANDGRRKRKHHSAALSA